MKQPRKLKAAFAAAALLTSLAGTAKAQTVNWGSPFFGSFADSNGAALDSGYTFMLGTFADTFTPTSENIADWSANWLTIDVADYNPDFGYFTGTFDLNETGGSTSPESAPSVFYLKPVYLWVHGGYNPEDGSSEWFLAHSATWTLPDAPEDGEVCCGGTPIQWTTNDLQTGEPPVVGGHNNTAGGGAVSNPGFYDIQTYNVPIPEPTAPALAIVFSCMFLIRRIRIRVC